MHLAYPSLLLSPLETHPLSSVQLEVFLHLVTHVCSAHDVKLMLFFFVFFLNAQVFCLLACVSSSCSELSSLGHCTHT